MDEDKRGSLIVVWFSCGAASAVAAKLSIERFSTIANVRIVYNPVAEEDSDNVRFLRDVEAWLGRPIEIASNPDWPSCSARDVWAARRFMSGPKGAPCTAELKKAARAHWEQSHRPDWHVLGFTADEMHRHDRFVRSERDNVIPVLIEAGVTKEMCFEILRQARIQVPRIYGLGYPNANCIGCVKATSPTYWNMVRRTHPEVFADRAGQSREIGARLVRFRGKRIFLDELPADARGRKIRTWECGNFCTPEPQ